ncbi:MAG TPA: hypothetical protein VGL17_10330, partial [Gemmatimonadaceae bacterium]
MNRYVVLVATFLAAVFAGRSAWAHAAPHSILMLDLRAHNVDAELRLPISELEIVAGHPLLSEEAAIVDLERGLLGRVVQRDLHVESLDGASWLVEIGDVQYAAD